MEMSGQLHALATLRPREGFRAGLNALESDTSLQSHYRPEVPRGFQEVKVPRLRDNAPE